MLEVTVTIKAPELVEAINNFTAIFNCPDPAPAEPKITNATFPYLVPLANDKTTPATPKTVAAPVSAPAPAPTTPAPTVPAPATAVPAPATAVPAPASDPAVTASPVPTIEAISRAGAALCEQGKMPQLIDLLGKYGVQAVTQLKDAAPETLVAFTNDLKALGANL